MSRNTSLGPSIDGEPAFDMTFAGLDSSNHLEGFDFDSFLEEGDVAPAAIKGGSDLSHTISKDNAGGSLAQKDRNLRLLLKGADDSTISASKARLGEGSSNDEDDTIQKFRQASDKSSGQLSRTNANPMHSRYRPAMPLFPPRRSKRANKISRMQAGYGTRSSAVGLEDWVKTFEQVNGNS
ncbi:MAG: hypothetical protein Q9220_003640 [cf. Caloplaca sp. 1 TL-2023]